MESHEQDLLDEIHDQDKVRLIQEDYRQVDLGPATTKLLDFASKLTINLKDMSKSDVESLRSSGFADEDILDAVHIISYFNFSNRVMDAMVKRQPPRVTPGEESEDAD